MDSSPIPSDPKPDCTSGLFYEPPFQNAITAGTGWDKVLCEILHSKSRMSYHAYEEIASAYAEVLQLLEASNGSLVGLYYRSDLKQILSTAEYFVQYSKRHQSLKFGKVLGAGWSSIPIGDGIVDCTGTHQTKIKTDISLLRDQTRLERRYKDFDNRRLLEFITRVSKILAEVSIAMLVCLIVLAVALPWYWKFIISKAVFALAIGTVACFGFDVSNRMQKVALTVQNLYMHYFLFIWAWNDFAYLIQIAETDPTGVSDLEDARNFQHVFAASFVGRREKLQRLQMRISVSPAYLTKKEAGLWRSIGRGKPFWKRRTA
ncbi:hypothetical protein IW261DRAFT_1492316 [Armillaria novae-zelandiae]|uniref:Uncharacterized protein n=1 Tax=Armillaria novae-zelandiae TaxID=153914 RepID=A0AA39P255_9AGAR|nr:hypothetical protein IW261DRAFT_1492316 [Armillaria novae-zelandiae]